MVARVAVCVALLFAAGACNRKETPAARPPKPVPRPRPVAADAARPAFPDSCAGILKTLAPDIDVHDGRVVLVLFVAVWATPSREIVPIVESEIAQDAQRWRLLKADLTRESQLGDRCGVQIIPMLIAFVNGKPVSQLDGAATALRVRKFLEAIPSTGP